MPLLSSLAILCLAGAAVAASNSSDDKISLSNLRCEYLENPVGIDAVAPRLSWQMEGKGFGLSQTAYQILVSSDESRLNQNFGDLWDSGKVPSDSSIQIEYQGDDLHSRQRVWWKVRVWDQNGQATPYSKPAHWEMGLLSPSDWKASWVGMPTSGHSVTFSGAKWIWTDEGNPLDQAPVGARVFRTVVECPTKPTYAVAAVAADDTFKLFVNDKELAQGAGWRSVEPLDLGDAVVQGRNVVTIEVNNEQGAAGLLAKIEVGFADGSKVVSVSDAGWQFSQGSSGPFKEAKVLGDPGMTPWGPSGVSTPADPAPHVRREFEIARPVKQARIYASAKGLYKLFLDGHLVTGAIFTPGWTDYKKRIQYQTYDVSKALSQGRHALGMLLGDGWYCGHVGWGGRNQYGEKPMGLLQLEIEYADGSRETFGTDESWKVADGGIRSSDFMMGEAYDARKEQSGWSKAGFNDGNWSAAERTSLGDVPLVAQRSKPVEHVETLEPKAITEPVPGHFVFDLGQNMVGWAKLHVRGKAGDTVTLRFAEMLNPDGTIYTTNLRKAKCTDTYTLSGEGEETYEPSFTFHGFRYVEVTGYPGRPDKSAVEGIVISSAIDRSGQFECSNSMVNQLQHNIRWGMMGNYLEVPTDCPQRDERLGWMGDAQVFARTATYEYDIAAFMNKWCQDVEDGQSPEGGFADVSPRVLVGNAAPAWGDAGVIVPWTMYLAYGDKRQLAEHYDAMKNWVEYIFAENPNYLWLKRRGNDYGDWLNVDDETPKDVLATAYFLRSTELLAYSAALLEKHEDADKYVAMTSKIREAFNKEFVAPTGEIKGNTQTDYVVALAFNILPPEQRKAAADRLAVLIMTGRNGHLSTGFVGVGNLNNVLSRYGHNDIAYKLLLTDTYPSWGYSIRQGATTIWERWDGWTEEKGFQDPGMNSFNHYSLGSVGEWMFSTVAGIDLDPAKPGYKHIILHPSPGEGLDWVRCSFESPYGAIRSDWRREGEKTTYVLEVPPNTTATAFIPSDIYPVNVNGKPLVNAGLKYEVGKGRTQLELGSGRYTVVVG